MDPPLEGKDTLKATFYMVMSAVGFALMGLFVKLGSQRGFPVMEMIAARAGISLILSYWDIHRKKLNPWGHNHRMLVMRGVLGFLALIAVYTSLTLLPLAEATLIQYLHPIFTASLAWLFLNESASKATLICMLLGFLGLLIISQPQAFGGQSISSSAVMIALLGAAITAGAYTVVRHLSISEHPSVIVLYFPLISFPATLIFGWDNFILPVGIDWFILLAIGMTTQLGQVTLTKGIALQTAGKAAAISYVQVVFAAILGVFVLGEPLSLSTLIGAALIISGIMINQAEIYRKVFPPKQ